MGEKKWAERKEVSEAVARPNPSISTLFAMITSSRLSPSLARTSRTLPSRRRNFSGTLALESKRRSKIGDWGSSVCWARGKHWSTSTLIWPVGQPQFNTRNTILIKKAIFLIFYGVLWCLWENEISQYLKSANGKQNEEEIGINKKDF